MDRLPPRNAGLLSQPEPWRILFIDLDDFKRLNDSQGHHLGDLLLQQIAHRLKECVREDDTVAHAWVVTSLW